tara:strand:+ start:4146 stop:4706 length:561 start_codon:yes stop_codon:yes gene_type:complete
MRFSNLEKTELLKAWIAISIAFAIVLRGTNLGFLQNFILSALTVGVGFLLHELAHKIVAQKYGCWAEFRSFDSMLLLAIGMSFLGFVFAAPGAVFIKGNVTTEKNGKISIAGPITNIILAVLFFILLQFFNTGYLNLISTYGFRINSWLALFNMIPIWNFDGSKVLRWNKIYYAIVVIITLIFMVI